MLRNKVQSSISLEQPGTAYSAYQRRDRHRAQRLLLFALLLLTFQDGSVQFTWSTTCPAAGCVYPTLNRNLRGCVPMSVSHVFWKRKADGQLTPLLPEILISCVASPPGTTSVFEMLSSCSFCDFGTAACRPALEMGTPELFLNRPDTCTTPSALRCSINVTTIPFES